MRGLTESIAIVGCVTRLCLCVVGVGSLVAAVACSANRAIDPPVATPSFSAHHSRVPLGSPLEVTYRFVVAASAATFDQNYRVFVHFLDEDREMMWTDDHDPSVPTSQWKAGQTVEYGRTIFVPIYPYVGLATVEMGLHAPTSGTRLPLAGEDSGQRAYKVAGLQLVPQTENVFLIYKDGWHQAEVSETDPTVEWQWTRKEATIVFLNPRRDALFYLHVDTQSDALPEPQRVELRGGNRALDSFALGDQPMVRKVPLSLADLGSGRMVELKIQVDRTFVPALLPAAKNGDSRELGIRVFHAFVEPR